MNEESRIEALEHEVKILKNEIQTTLLEIREQILNHYYPELRAEEPVQLNSRSLPVRQPVGRPGLPAKSAPRPQEESNSLAEIEAKGQVLPFSDIFLDDLSTDDEDDMATNELVNSRRPVADLDDEFDDDTDDDFEDLMVDALPTDLPIEVDKEPSNGNDNPAGKIKVQKVVPSSNAFGRAPQTREVDFRQLKQGGMANKPAATPAPESAETAEAKAKAGRQNFAALATWVEEGVTKVGKERTTQIVETYATGGKLSSETKNSLLQLISLAEEEEPAPAVGSQEMLGLMVGLDQILR